MDATCRFVSARAWHVFEALRFVPVRVKIRLHVTRFVSCMPEICLFTGDLRLIKTPLPQRVAPDVGPKFINPRPPDPAPTSMSRLPTQETTRIL
jgi:hypothetical protein